MQRYAHLPALAALAALIPMLSACTTHGASFIGPTPGPASGNLYVFNASPSGGSIEIFPAATNGNVAPLSSISGSATGLDAPFYGTVDSQGRMYAPNTAAYSVTTYAAGSSGDVAPSTTLEGSKTELGYPSGVAVDTSGKTYVANPQKARSYTSITVYGAGANGNVPPIARIKGSKTNLQFPYNVALDGSGYVYVTNSNGGSSGGWITVYSPGANGNVSPVRTIAGSNTGLDGPAGIAVDGTGRLFVSNRNNDTVTVYAPGANGNVSPSLMISGYLTGLSAPNGVTLDSLGNLYVANEAPPSITVYADGATGNVAPARTISGANTGLNQPFGLAIH